MAEAPLQAADVAPQTPDVAQIERSVHFQANKARLLPEAEWGDAYAGFLTTCAACHEKTGVTVRPTTPR